MIMANKQTGSQGGKENSGNFANDREKAAEAGRKGGQQSGSDKSGGMAPDKDSGRKGGRS